MPTIDDLQLEVKASSSSAVKGIDSLSSSLNKLKNATKNGIGGLTSLSYQIKNINDSLSSVDANGFSKIDKLASSLEKLKSLGQLKLSSSIGNQIRNIGSATTSLQNVDFSNVSTLASAISPLAQMGNNGGLKSVITQLQKLPELATSLNTIDWVRLSDQFKSLVNNLKPLATELDKIGNAFSKLPSKVTQVVKANQKAVSSNKQLSKSYINLYAKISMIIAVLKNGLNTVGSWIKEALNYEESLNVVNASLGEYASAATKYAEQVGEIMGIDPAEWLGQLGIINTIIEGFGVASDQAYIMSTNLTQLAYDLTSYYGELTDMNIDEAFQKIQSGISGELEPLRRLGYDLSVARLQQEALNLGIEKSVSNMTQAEKAQLRYYAIMTQVTDVQGDMARTLNAPANQLRVLKAQVTQCARALGQVFIPVLNAVLPYALALAKVLRYLAQTVASFFGYTLPDVDYSSLTTGASAIADSVDDTANGLDDATSAAKKLKNAMLGIDELNIISPNDDSSSGSGSSSVGVGGGDLGIDLPTYDFIGDAVSAKADAITQTIKDHLAEIGLIASGALLAIGLILAFTGHPIKGVALMAAGAVGLGITATASWGGLTDEVKKTIQDIMLLLGAALIVVGAILAFSGAATNLGIGLIIAGVASMVTPAILNWEGMGTDLQNSLSKILAICSVALLAIGAIIALAVPSHAGLGIALMVASLASISGAVALNWTYISANIKANLDKILAILGGALLVIGAILTFTGVNLPLGIGLMIAGAASLAGAVALNWNAIVDKIKTTIKKIGAIVGAALIAIGIILILTGAGIPLGLGLLAAGAVSLGSAIALNWNTIVDKVKEGLGKIKDAFNDFKEKVSTKLEETKEKISDWASTVKTKFTDKVQDIKDAASEWGDSFKEKLSSKFDNAKSWVKEKITDPVAKALGAKDLPDLVVNLKNNASQWWSDTKTWWADETKDGVTLDSYVKLAKKGWTTVKGWIGNIPILNQAIQLIKQAWTTVKNWVGNIPVLDQAIQLIKKAWTTVKGWVGNIPTLDQGIQLVKKAWTTVKNWVGSIPILDQAIQLIKNGWSTVKNWIGNIPAVSQFVNLAKDGWSTVSQWVRDRISGAVSVTVNLVQGWVGSLKKWLGFEDGGIIGANGSIKMYANGGVIPAYAGGTSRAHGSMFVAGENGAELVGHVNGTTEVLNRFQLANVMQASIVSGMSQFMPMLRAISNNIITNANGVINAVMSNANIISSNYAYAGATGYDPNMMLAQSIYEETRPTTDDVSMYQNMVDFYRNYVESNLNRIVNASETQANKNEQTIVQVGNKTITDAVTKQKKANGYSFVRE